MIRVLLADDHAVVRMGFRMLIENTPNFTVVAEAQSGEEAVRLYGEHKPDVVVMDLNMPGIGGMEAIHLILVKHPDARVLTLSAHADTVHCRRALKAGTLGYLSKRIAAEELIRALNLVADGKTYLDPSIAQQMAIQQVTGDKDLVDTLSGREFDVFLMLARGYSVNEIAEIYKLSPRTIGTHLYNIKQKLGASNSAELTLLAIRSGLIEPTDGK